MTKVFIGNLAFKTTDQDLQAYFEGHGEIKSSVIITRGRRSLGYGFVEFVNQEDAEAAAKALDQSTFLERQVEIANPVKVGGENDGPAPRRKPQETVAEDAPRKKRRNRRKKAPVQTDTSVQEKKSRKKERAQKEKVLSKTTLFVANLPFSVGNEDLQAIFEGPGLVSARVVRTRNGRSRGYGFVEFSSEAEQQKALEEKQGHTVTGDNGVERNLAISVSNPLPPEEATTEQ